MDRELDQINVIPLVDVMLVLLVIVLTTANTTNVPIWIAFCAVRGCGEPTPHPSPLDCG